MDQYTDRLRSLEDNDRYQSAQLAELKFMSGSTQTWIQLSEKRFELAEKRFDQIETSNAKRFDLMEESLKTLTAMMNRWRGILLCAVFLGPIIGVLVNLIIRLVLFGKPLTMGGGILHP